MRVRTRSAERPGRRHEGGSAYLITLLVLVVLTLLGLSLVLVTSTEMQIGSNERTQQRTFYSADAGVGIAAARVLVASDHSEQTYTLNEVPSASAPATLLTNTVQIGPVVPLIEAPCNLCEINNAGGYSESAYHRVNLAVTSTGRRGAGATVVGEQILANTIDIQPWKVPTSAFFALHYYNDAELAEKIKF
jgi:Tfp pilus assembly protein PilX